jgi:O-antigen/teichoic acid export membrane protein
MKLISVKNVIFNWVGMISTMIYAFFLTPFVVHNLGDAHYGIWNLIMACVGYMTVLDFGIQSSVNRYIAKCKGLGDKKGVLTVYSNAIAVYWCIGILTIILGLALAFNIEKIFRIASEDVSLARRVMLLMVIYTAVEFPCNVFGALMYAYQRFGAINIITSAMLGVQALVVWFALTHKTSLLLFALVTVACGLTKYLIQYIYTHRLVTGLGFKLGFISKPVLSQMLVFSGITFLAVIMNYIIFRTDNIVIGIFLSPQAITMYSIGFMLSDYAAQVVGRMCNTFTPRFSEHEARGEVREFNKLLIDSSRFASLIGVPIGLAVIAMGDEFITLWMGKSYEDAYWITVVMMISRMAGFPTASMYSMLYGIGKHHIILYTGILEAVSNLILSLILVKKYGILGVAIGTMIPMILVNILFPFLVLKSVEFDFKGWFKAGIIHPLAFCIIFYAGIWSLCHMFQQVSWGNLILKMIMITVIYAILFWFIGLKSHERSILMSRLKFAAS